MQQGQQAIVLFNEVGKDDVNIVGGKGANLGEMTQAGMPVPPGFIVTASAYFDFMEKSAVRDKITSWLKSLDPSNSKQLQQVATVIKKLIMETPMPPETAEKIEKAYDKIGDGLVAVRSSATAEDLPEASFAGQQRTFLNVHGAKEVVSAVQGCWASLFEPRAIFYRHHQGFDHFKVGIAVPVQKMVQSKTSGVMFTLEPVTSASDRIVIEAVFGLGEAIVSGEVTPDLYVVNKESLKILKRKTVSQETQLVKNPDPKAKETNIWVPIPDATKDKPKLSESEITKLAQLGKKIEKHYNFPQDIEWAKEDDHIYIVQTRPVTTIREKAEVEPEIANPVLLSGEKASPGIASGPARVLPDASRIDEVKTGDVLVAEMTTPDFVPAMKRAVAIVTDRGGRTAHAAIVSRELGIPCVVGAEKATTTIKNGQIITVDGSHGKIYDGKVTRRIKTTAVADAIREAIKTETKVYVNLAQPELAENVAKRNVDGVGLLRAEFMVAQINEHPQYMIKQNRGQEFVDKLYAGINTFTKAFDPRPVVYRTTDFKTNEYRKLKGGEEFEPEEENPMIGYRGASRYITDIEVFRLEIEAIKKVRQEFKNLWVMIPFVRTVDELDRTKQLMEAEGLKRSKDFKLWMMVEVPSNIFLIDKFLAVGIDGISIGSNDLTQLILGVDRDSEKLAGTFDERNEAVMIALERAIKVSKKMGVTSSICGQAPSDYPELTERLVEWGINSVSVNPDVIGTTREIVAKAEAKLKKK